jgi:LPPG:FO 2-phospho-L-lactate transferase
MRLVSTDVKVTVLVGGVGGARFLLGVQQYLGLGQFLGAATGPAGDHEVTAIVNVGDDAWMHGVRICPDLDTCMYTLGGGIDPERGWGHANETWHAKEELAAYGVQPDWFGLGDRDLATHLVRSQMLRAGYPLSQVTEALCARWKPGVRLLPVTDDRSETHVVVTDPEPGAEEGSRRAIHFQEWWVRYRSALPTHRFVFVGADAAKPAPGVLEAIAAADVVLIAPSNPVVSIAPILAVAEVRDAIAGGPAPVIGVSPIIGGSPVRGMADKCLATVGVEVTAAGVGGLYGARSDGGLLDGWLVDSSDSSATVPGVPTQAVPLWMSSEAATAQMVADALALAGLA